MSYVLDGIKTAMEERPQEGKGWWAVHCPCGFIQPPAQRIIIPSESIEVGCERERAALRFHYIHCPRARTDQEKDDD